MSDTDDDETFELELQDEEESEDTPADTRAAINAAVLRSERYSRKAAYYSFKSYQIATRSEKRLDAVEKDVATIKRQGFRVPNIVSAVAIVVAVAAMLLVGCVITGRVPVP